jgi:hypothetical protein
MRAAHPRPRQDRLIQQAAIALALVMLAAALLQVVLALLITPGGLFLLTALITLLLIPFVLMLTTATPPVTVSDDGLLIEPVIWRARFVPWAQVQAIQPYPLLPQREAETTRRALVGRARYQPAAGIMLVIAGLPPQYRIAGLLAGTGGQPVIAVTNRTHTDYEQVAARIMSGWQGHTSADSPPHERP